MAENVDIVIVGALNHDIVTGVDAAPGPGETVLARTLMHTNGGKAGNAAAAAARAGARVRLVSSVGADAEGDMQLDNLTGYGVDVAGVARQTDLRTSLALIWVTPDGENSIIATPGAKDCVTPELVRQEASGLTGLKVVLAESEVGAAVSDASAEVAREVGARFILSCGPVVLPSASTLRLCDPVIVNVTEARDLLGQLGADATLAEAKLADELLPATGARSVIVTLGARGSLLAQSDGPSVMLPAAKADQVVDTTGAGDAYCGVLAARLALGDTLEDACRQAAVAGAAAVGWLGARPAITRPLST